MPLRTVSFYVTSERQRVPYLKGFVRRFVIREKALFLPVDAIDVAVIECTESWRRMIQDCHGTLKQIDAADSEFVSLQFSDATLSFYGAPLRKEIQQAADGARRRSQ